MSHPIEAEASITREGPVSAVSVPAGIGVGNGLVHSLDYVVMLQVMFDVAAGTKTTPLLVWERLKARGIRSSKNADELVGRNAVYESFARLVGAGFLRRVELPNEKHPGRKGPIVYRMYDNPAWNPDWQATQAGTDPLSPAEVPLPEKPQVGTLPGTPEAGSGEVGVSAGQNASRNAGSGVRGSGVPGSGKRVVPAGQNASGVPGSGTVSPPHPPGGGGNYHPPTPQAGRRVARAAAPRGEEADPAARFTAERLREGVEFLTHLPMPFTVGPQIAPRLAPLLLKAVEATGWELDGDLAAELTRNPEGVRKGWRVLETDRFPGLVLRSMVRRPRAGSAAGGQPEADAECGRGCDSGWIETPDGMTACACRSPRQRPA